MVEVLEIHLLLVSINLHVKVEIKKVLSLFFFLRHRLLNPFYFIRHPYFLQLHLLDYVLGGSLVFDVLLKVLNLILKLGDLLILGSQFLFELLVLRCLLVQVRF